jgi:hypothetical protein
MKPLPADEKNPLNDRANAEDRLLWLACKEARALIRVDVTPSAKARDDKR